MKKYEKMIIINLRHLGETSSKHPGFTQSRSFYSQKNLQTDPTDLTIQAFQCEANRRSRQNSPVIKSSRRRGMGSRYGAKTGENAQDLEIHDYSLVNEQRICHFLQGIWLIGNVKTTQNLEMVTWIALPTMIINYH